MVGMDSCINLIMGMNDIKIYCDKPAYDGYEASNLSKGSLGKGFMAERFVSVPVTVSVRFPCPVFLHYISIDNTLGSFTSTGIQVLSYSTLDEARMASCKPIGRCYDTKPGTLKFMNRRLYPYSDKNSHDEVNRSNAVQMFDLSSHDYSLLQSVRLLSIRITRTSGGSIPVLRSLEVYGKPSSKHFIKPHREQELSGYTRPSPSKFCSIKSVDAGSQLNTAPTGIPQEFIDPLTCETMVLPVILPSGNTVDQSTLDKHIEAENAWGRKPCDPFTGISLSQTSQPIINHKLKERIDHYYLTQNLTAPRVLGTKRSSTDDQASMHKRPRSHNDLDTHSTSPSPSHNRPKSRTYVERLNSILNRKDDLRTVSLPEPPVGAECTSCHSVSTCGSLYKLSCDHKMCRVCLTEGSKELTCGQCGVHTPHADVTRDHSTHLLH